MPQPFFSIVIPTRGRPELFRDALVSALWQDFDDSKLSLRITIMTARRKLYWTSLKKIIVSEALERTGCSICLSIGTLQLNMPVADMS